MAGRFVRNPSGERALLNQVTQRAKDNMQSAVDHVASQARAKAPKRSGLLASEIAGEVSIEKGVVIGRVGVIKRRAGAFYWRFIERGTSKMAAHPFLRPALFNNLADVMRLLGVKRR